MRSFPRLASLNSAFQNRRLSMRRDTTLLAISTPGAPATIATPVRSTFQTYTVSIRTLLDVTWQMRRANATAWISGVLW